MVYKEYSVLKRMHKEYSEQIINIDGGIGVLKMLYCCGFEQPCKVYNLPTQKAWKRLYFMDECAMCRQSIAVLQECSISGDVRVLKRLSGKKAVLLRDKLSLKNLTFNNVKGTLQNERTFYFDSGYIYNFNNRKLKTNEEFLAL